MFVPRFQDDHSSRRAEMERELEELQQKMRMRSTVFSNPAWYEPPWTFQNQVVEVMPISVSTGSAQVTEHRQREQSFAVPNQIDPDVAGIQSNSNSAHEVESSAIRERSSVPNSICASPRVIQDDEKAVFHPESRSLSPEASFPEIDMEGMDTRSSIGSRPPSGNAFNLKDSRGSSPQASRLNSADTIGKRPTSLSYRLYEGESMYSEFASAHDPYNYDRQLDSFISQWNKGLSQPTAQRVQLAPSQPKDDTKAVKENSARRGYQGTPNRNKFANKGIGFPNFTTPDSYDSTYKDENGLSPGAGGFTPPLVGTSSGYAGRTPSIFPRPLAQNGYDENYVDSRGRRPGDRGFIPPTFYVTMENERVRKEAGLHLGYDKDYHDNLGRRFGDPGFIPPAYNDGYADKNGLHVGEEGFIPPPHGAKGTYGGTKIAMSDPLHYGQYDCNYIDRWGRKAGQAGFVPPLVALSGGHPALACLKIPNGYDEYYVDPSGRRQKDSEFLAPVAREDDTGLVAQLEQIRDQDLEAWINRMGLRSASEYEKESDNRKIEQKLLEIFADNTPVKRYMREKEAENKRIAETGRKIKAIEEERIKKEEELLEQMEKAIMVERCLEDESVAVALLEEHRSLLVAQLEAERSLQKRKRESVKAVADQSNRFHLESEKLRLELEETEKKIAEAVEQAKKSDEATELLRREEIQRLEQEAELQRQQELERKNREAPEKGPTEVPPQSNGRSEEDQEPQAQERKRKAVPPLATPEELEIERIREEALEKEKTRVKTKEEEEANAALRDLQEQLEKNPPQDPEELRKLRLKIRDCKMQAARAAMKGGAGSIPASPLSALSTTPSSATNLRKEKRDLFLEKLSPKLTSIERAIRESVELGQEIELTYDNGDIKLVHENCSICGCPFGASENGVTIAGLHCHQECCVCFACRSPLEMTCVRLQAQDDLIFHEECIQRMVDKSRKK